MKKIVLIYYFAGKNETEFQYPFHVMMLCVIVKSTKQY